MARLRIGQPWAWPALSPSTPRSAAAIRIFFFTSELRLWHIYASTKIASCPAGIICAGFFAPLCAPACVCAPSKRDSSHEIRERTKRKPCWSAEGIIQLCRAAGAPDARHPCGGNHRRHHQGGQKRRRWGDAPRFAPVPRNAPDVPELTVIHINFIRIMINALDSGQLVPPEGSDVAKEIDEYVRIIRGRALAKGIESAPAARRARIAPR